MKLLSIINSTIFALSIVSCNLGENHNMEKQQTLEEQLGTLNGLLRDPAFAVQISIIQDSAYYSSQKQPVPDLPAKDSFLLKSFKDEKIATNVAAFYAVECGIGALIDQKGGTPLEWLEKIASKKIDSTEVLLLNRFANATWKAGQPFRNLSRIKKPNFIVANLLSAAETKKDYDQVMAAASQLLASLKPLSNASKDDQFKKIDQLLKDKQYADAMARHMEAAYYQAEGKPVPPFVTAIEDSATIKKSALDEKLAINLAGFYALECGVNYLVTAQNKLPSDVLKSIVNDSINQKDKRLLERFANATWKAGQPFRSLDRITRDIFMPFDLLPAEEVKKDWDQVEAAAGVVLKSLKH